MCNFHVYKWENAYSKDLNAWRILMNFHFLLRWKKAGALVHVYLWEHIVSLNYRITWWIFTKFGRDKGLATPHICIDFWAKSAQGWIQGRAIIGQRRTLFPKNFFRPKGYGNKPNAKQLSRSIWEEVLLFLVSLRSQIFDAFLAGFFWTLSFWCILMQFL